MARKTTSDQEAITMFNKVLLGIKREDALMIASAVWYASGLLAISKHRQGIHTNTGIEGVNYIFAYVGDEMLNKVQALLDAFEKIM